MVIEYKHNDQGETSESTALCEFIARRVLYLLSRPNQAAIEVALLNTPTKPGAIILIDDIRTKNDRTG